jgi:glycerol-3-phosphate dehydrogenase (NAD(P)+)
MENLDTEKLGIKKTGPVKTVTVLGAGAWGTALSNLLAENGQDVILWCYEQDVVKDITLTGINNNFLSGVKLDTKIRPTSDMQVAIKSSEFIFEAIPVKYMRSVLTLAKPYVTKEHKFIVTSKGIEQDTAMLPSQIVCDIFGVQTTVSALGGPNFAKDLSARDFTATVVASKDIDTANQIAQMLACSYFKPYLSDDINGVQIGGAAKNIFALTIGMAHGLGYGENTIAFLITRCFIELSILSQYFGGRQETVYGLAGFGDLFLTCSSAVSKNFKIGRLLGQGIPLNELSKKYAAMPEGIYTIQTVKKLVDQNGLNLPVCLATYDVIFQGLSFKNILNHAVEQGIDREQCEQS